MSNMNGNTHKTKLRGTDMLKYHTQYRPHSDSGLETDHAASSSSHCSNTQLKDTVDQPRPIFEPHRHKSGGRGMAIQQISQSIMNPNYRLKNPDLDFSNTKIEDHFKNLKEENIKKIKEANEKIWGKMLYSNKKS